MRFSGWRGSWGCRWSRIRRRGFGGASFDKLRMMGGGGNLRMIGGDSKVGMLGKDGRVGVLGEIGRVGVLGKLGVVGGIAYDGEVLGLLGGYGVDVCVLAGYMLVVGSELCRAWPDVEFASGVAGWAGRVLGRRWFGGLSGSGRGLRGL